RSRSSSSQSGGGIPSRCGSTVVVWGAGGSNSRPRPSRIRSSSPVAFNISARAGTRHRFREGALSADAGIFARGPGEHLGARPSVQPLHDPAAPIEVPPQGCLVLDPVVPDLVADLAVLEVALGRVDDQVAL